MNFNQEIVFYLNNSNFNFFFKSTLKKNEVFFSPLELLEEMDLEINIPGLVPSPPSVNCVSLTGLFQLLHVTGRMVLSSQPGHRDDNKA